MDSPQLLIINDLSTRRRERIGRLVQIVRNNAERSDTFGSETGQPRWAAALRVIVTALGVNYVLKRRSADPLSLGEYPTSRRA
jgi:hypothetical protein